MVSVITQPEANRRRGRLSFCYLCGRILRDGDETTREHIVPKAVLGQPPSTSAWACVLDVHAECERREKGPTDHLFALWRNLLLSPEEKERRAEVALYGIMDAAGPDGAEEGVGPALAAINLALAAGNPTRASTTNDPQELNRASDDYIDSLVACGGVSDSDARKTKQRMAAVLDPRGHLTKGQYRGTPFKVVDGVTTPEPFFPVEGMDHVFTAVWTWVRGLHALLYESFLPTTVRHVVLTPIPAFSGTDCPCPYPGDEVHRKLLATLYAADQAGKLDRVEYWDEQCCFRCSWIYLPAARDFARCVWRLYVPGPVATQNWWGWYDLPCPPTGAHVLEESDFDDYNGRL